MKRVKMIVCGTVQGVGYRYFVQNEAKKYGIKGFVRNLPEGDVEIDAEGQNQELSLFMQICKAGSNYSKIQDMVIHNIPFYGFENFIIKR